MTQSYSDIKIEGLDDKASGPSGEGALMRLVLTLSRSAPPPWAEYFNRAWQENFYMMKRRASAFGNQIEIICMPDELQTEHVPQLKKVIAATNLAYAEHIERQKQDREAQDAAAKKQREDLSKLKNDLDFD